MGLRIRESEFTAVGRDSDHGRTLLLNNFPGDLFVVPMLRLKIPVNGAHGFSFACHIVFIQAFEKATGVDLIIDETPEVIQVSSFDPVRRAVAVKALQMLIKDGRIQPAKIEELVKKAQKNI